MTKKILDIRNVAEEPDDAENRAREKQIKFFNFILHLTEKHALRTWKEKVWGVGGDPRLALMMCMERDRIRDEYYKPIADQRKNMKVARNLLKDRNQKIA